MKNYDKPVKINRNQNWLYIPNHPYKIFIIGCSGSGKTNVLLNLIKHQQPDIDNIYLFVKNLFKTKYRSLINRIEKVGIKELKNPKAFIDHLQIIDDAYANLEDYNSTKKRKVLIVFDDMVADMEANKVMFDSRQIVLKRQKTQHFPCFYIAILFQRA